jgi:hypothetical protein
MNGVCAVPPCGCEYTPLMWFLRCDGINTESVCRIGAHSVHASTRHRSFEREEAQDRMTNSCCLHENSFNTVDCYTHTGVTTKSVHMSILLKTPLPHLLLPSQYPRRWEAKSSHNTLVTLSSRDWPTARPRRINADSAHVQARLCARPWRQYAATARLPALS